MMTTITNKQTVEHTKLPGDRRSLAAARALLCLLCALMCGTVSAQEPKEPASNATKGDTAVQRNQPDSFDPADFTVVPPRRFEDLRVGEVFRAPSRTLTDAHVTVRFGFAASAFCGDYLHKVAACDAILAGLDD